MTSRVVTKFYLLQATRSVGFISPVFTLFLLRALNFTQIGLLTAFSAALAVGVGVLADRAGRQAAGHPSAVGETTLAALGAAFLVATVAVVLARGSVRGLVPPNAE